MSSIPPTVSAVDSPSGQTPLEHELAVLLVDSLNLEVAAADVDPNAPLYGEGLGLDSIDILEVALEVSRRYGFQLRSDDERNGHCMLDGLDLSSGSLRLFGARGGGQSRVAASCREQDYNGGDCHVLGELLCAP